MRSCPSCGGIIGRDCFNPIECAEITRRMDAQKCNCGCDQLLGELDYIRGVDMPAMEQTIQEGCNVIGQLLDVLIQYNPDSEVVKQAENYYRQHYTMPEKVADKPDDDLPF